MANVVLQVSINGSAIWQSGGLLNVPSTATVDMRLSSTIGVQSAVFEFTDMPPGFSCPSGWQNLNGVYTYSNSYTPPRVTLPALSSQTWGPYPIRLRLNGNPLQFNQDGSLNDAYDPSLTDVGTVLDVASPNVGMRGVFFGEATQFDALRAAVGGIMDALRRLDAGITGGGGSLPAGAEGDLLAYHSGAWSVLPPGPASDVVTSNGSGAFISYQPSSSGSTGDLPLATLVAGPVTETANPGFEYPVDVSGGNVVLNIATMAVGQLVRITVVNGDLGTHSLTINAPGGVVFTQPPPNVTTTGSSIILNQSEQDGTSLVFKNYGVSGTYNIRS
jgi:hypothetical protein